MIPALVSTAFEVGGELVRVALELWQARASDEAQAVARLRETIAASVLRLTASLDQIDRARKAADEVLAKLRAQHATDK